MLCYEWQSYFIFHIFGFLVLGNNKNVCNYRRQIELFAK
jgi:hypothetical protein